MNKLNITIWMLFFLAFCSNCSNNKSNENPPKQRLSEQEFNTLVQIMKKGSNDSSIIKNIENLESLRDYDTAIYQYVDSIEQLNPSIKDDFTQKLIEKHLEYYKKESEKEIKAFEKHNKKIDSLLKSIEK